MPGRPPVAFSGAPRAPPRSRLKATTPPASGETIVIARSGAYAGLVSFWSQPIFVTDAFSVHPDVDLHTIFKGIFPFLGAMILGLIILILFPDIVLILPGLVR